MSNKQNERAEAVKMLRKYLKPGATVYCVLRSVSKSGMSRRIDFFTIVRAPKGRDYMQYLSGWMATLGIGSLSSRAGQAGLRVDGCGMDMGFHCVYELGSILHKDGKALRTEWL